MVPSKLPPTIALFKPNSSFILIIPFLISKISSISNSISITNIIKSIKNSALSALGNKYLNRGNGTLIVNSKFITHIKCGNYIISHS